MNDRTVLISGAGVAGPTLAYWLARQGYRPTVVERAAAPRSSGSPVDVRGPAVEVAETMGVMPALRDAGTEVTALTFVDGKGRRVGGLDLRALSWANGSHDVELPRGDLAAILYRASRDDAEYLFHDSIASLTQDAGGVDVTFDHAPARRFDLVIGADGLHSTVRRLAFGPESEFVEHMGLYVATLPLEGAVSHRTEVLVYNTPGRAIALHPSRGRALAAFIFRSPAIAGFDHRDADQHKRILTEAYAGGAFRTAELLDRVRAAGDLYFDSVSMVRLSSWCRGRVALVGDAASCLSLFGDGSSLAIAGAFTLAEALGSSTGDFQAAFRRYEAKHRLLVNPKQEGASHAAALVVPATWSAIVVRNLASRLWPVGAGVAWVRRRLADGEARL